MSKYSPGPWQWNRRWLYSAETPAKIILSYTTDDDGVHSTDEDARLIAAAPEMLEALKDYDDAFTGFDPAVRSSREEMRKAVIKARAAIAKATGAA